MKLTIIATAVALLITVGTMSLLASPAMAQAPPMDFGACADMGDAQEECQTDGNSDPDADSDGDSDTDVEAPTVQEVEDGQGGCVSDLWSIISGNSTGNC